LERQWAALQAWPDAGLIATYFRVIQDGAVLLENSNEAAQKRWDGYLGPMTVSDDCRYFPSVEPDFFPRFLPSCSDALLKREVFESVGLFDETVLYNEDFEFFLRVLARFPLAIVEQTLISCRRHDQKHSFNAGEMRESLFAVVNYMLQHPDKYPAGAPQVYRDRIKKNFLITEQALEEGRKKSSGQ
jgi:GT2 family glycosyltransferase